MVAPYSVDLRERVIQLKLTGQYTNKKIAELLSIGVTSVKEYIKKHRNKESLVPQKPTGRRPLINDEDKELIKSYIASYPDSTLKEHRDRLEHNTGKRITIQCMHIIIKSMNVSYKKKFVRSGAGS